MLTNTGEGKKSFKLGFISYRSSQIRIEYLNKFDYFYCLTQVQELLQQLTKKSAALEKIKAHLGGESSLLPSLQALQSQLVSFPSSVYLNFRTHSNKECLNDRVNHLMTNDRGLNRLDLSSFTSIP